MSPNYVTVLSVDMPIIVCLSRITKIHSKEMSVNTQTSCKITSRVKFNLQSFIFCWPCISIYLLVSNQFDAQLFYIIRLFHSSTCFEQTRAHHQEVNCINTASGIVRLCKWLSGAQVESVIQVCWQLVSRSKYSQPVHRTATYRDWRYQMLYYYNWPPDDEHVFARNM